MRSHCDAHLIPGFGDHPAVFGMDSLRHQHSELSWRLLFSTISCLLYPSQAGWADTPRELPLLSPQNRERIQVVRPRTSLWLSNSCCWSYCPLLSRSQHWVLLLETQKWTRTKLYGFYFPFILFKRTLQQQKEKAQGSTGEHEPCGKLFVKLATTIPLYVPL